MSLRFKVAVWLVVLVGFFMVDQYFFQSVLPSAYDDVALAQMKGEALHDTDFTFQDMLKNYLVYILCAAWTIGIFWKEICNCPCFKGEEN